MKRRHQLHRQHFSRPFLVALLMCAGAAHAQPQSQAELAQKKNCLGCHAIDRKILGPAYKDVAGKYAGQKDPVGKLTVKVMKGGAGVWGNIPMPANPQVSEAEARQLVQWILTTQ